MSYQQTVIMGNIGKIEQRFLPDGTSVVNFSVAVNDRYKKKDGTQVDETEWFNCVSWGKQSEIISQYFQKGSRIMVQGKMKTRTYDDQQGVKRYQTNLKVSEFSFVDKKPDISTQPAQNMPNQAKPDPNGVQQAIQTHKEVVDEMAGGFSDIGDDIPFI